MVSDHISTYNICDGDTPLYIDCATDSGINWIDNGEVYTCDVTRGGVCVNADQPDGVDCDDYQVRFICP
jgi:hypothetical protein